jgi:hypothetical protein
MAMPMMDIGEMSMRVGERFVSMSVTVPGSRINGRSMRMLMMFIVNVLMFML